MRKASSCFVALLLVASLEGSASAQTATPAPANPSAPPAPSPAVSSGEVAIPARPEVHDPMLEPVPPAANTLGSWKEALQLVRQRSTQLHISLAQIEQAEGQTRRALSGALPKLTGTGSVQYNLLQGNTMTGGFNGSSTQFDVNGQPVTVGKLPAGYVSAGLELRQPLINFNAWYGVGTSKERTEAAKLSLQDTQRLLLGTVAQAAVGVVTATRVAESSRVALSSALSTRDLTKRRAELGAASAVDVLRAETEVEASRAQIVQADESLRQSREALGQALGYPEGWNVSPNVDIDDLERTASQVCRPVDGITARADIRSAETSVRAAKRDRKAVDLTYVPTLDFVSNLGYVSYALANRNQEHIAWTVGGQLVWPLYDGGDRYGQNKITESAVTTASETLTQKKRDATLEIIQADRAVTVAQANVQVTTAQRDVLKEQARLSRLAFVNGSGTSFDLVDSERRLREAEIDLLIKAFSLFQARITAFLARSNCSI